MVSMTTNDGSGAESGDARAAAAPRFPMLLAARARLLKLDVPRRFAIDGKESAQDEVIAIDVELDSLLPPMGVGLALFVGDQVLVDSEQVDEKRVRFYSPATRSWSSGAQVALGLAGSGPPRVLSRSELELDWPAPEAKGASPR